MRLMGLMGLKSLKGLKGLWSMSVLSLAFYDWHFFFDFDIDGLVWYFA